jgi:hypothetical protein
VKSSHGSAGQADSTHREGENREKKQVERARGWAEGGAGRTKRRSDLPLAAVDSGTPIADESFLPTRAARAKAVSLWAPNALPRTTLRNNNNTYIYFPTRKGGEDKPLGRSHCFASSGPSCTHLISKVTYRVEEHSDERLRKSFSPDTALLMQIPYLICCTTVYEATVRNADLCARSENIR